MLHHTNTEGDNVSLQIQASGGDGMLSYSASGLPTGLSINSTTGLISGSIAYGDALTQNGLYSITVTADDAYGDSGNTTFNWTVYAAPPVANNDSYNVDHDATFSVNALNGVLANDSDPDKRTLSAVLVSQASDGSVSLNGDGSFRYTPKADWTGTDSFQYLDYDGKTESNIATVTLDVEDSGTITTSPLSYSVLHDQVLSVDAADGVLAGASASDGDALTAFEDFGPNDGSLQLSSDGSFTYTPMPGYVRTDSFSYGVSDGLKDCGPSTVTIDVTDQAPTTSNLSYTLPENSTLNVSVSGGLLSTASDVDGDPLKAFAATYPNYGMLSVNSDGSFTYATSDYSGSDSFQYTVSDGALTATGTVTLTINSDNTAPTAGPASYSVVHDTTLNVPANGLLADASDSDGDHLTVSAATQPSHGSVTVNPDGSFTYTPNALYVGSDSFTYTASDGSLTSTPATVSISVTNQVPVAVNDSYSVERNNDFYADDITGVLANDSDSDGDDLTAAVVSPPSNGTLTLNPDGSFDYMPDQNFTGTDSFTYQASDGVSSSNTATVTLTVTATPPSAANQSLDVLENNTLNALSGTLMLDDSNPDNMTLTAQDVTQPADGSVTVNSDGSFVYTPNNNFTGSDSFTYDLSDGTLTSSAATVTIDVTSTNTPPSAGNLGYSTDENVSLSTDSDSGVLSGASDGDGDTLTASLYSGPSDGTLQFNPDGSFTYTPNTNFYGTDSFQYRAFDGTYYSGPATVTIAVNEDLPTAVNDSYSVLPSGPTSVTADNGVLANDSDSEGTALTAVLETPPADGSVTLNNDGSFMYTPNSSFTGSDSFTYEAYNGVNYSSPATVSLTTNPVASDQSYSVTHDQSLSVDGGDGLLTGATDADGDALTASLATGPSDGMVAVNSDGSFTYTPNTHYVGTDSFTFTVSNGTNVSTPATATIDVTNDVPTANDLSFDTAEGTALNVSATNGLLASSSDDDGDDLTAQVVSGPSDGTIELGSGGNFTYTPNTGFYGTDSLTYDVSDGVSTSTPATVTIKVDQVVSESTPNSVYSAVATADNSSEVVVADQGLNQVDVFSVDSSGNLSSAPVSTYTVGSAPVGLAVGNFNDDGSDDVAVANSGDNTVSILLGASGNKFKTGTLLTGFDDPVAVVAGNFGNGQVDLAVVNQGNNTVSILLGNGNGTFTLYGTLTTGSTPTSIAAADFNNDGNLDLVVTNSASNSVSVFLGNGNGTFQSGVPYSVGTAPMSVTTGAFFSGDNTVDLAVANSGSNNVSVLMGNGDGTFQALTNYAVGNDPVSVVAGNFDGNGYLDLSVANKADNTLSSLYNYGNGQFFAGQTINEPPSEPVCIATGDFNHDGITDEVIAIADPKVVIKLGKNNQAATFNEGIGVAYSPDGNVVALAASTGGVKKYAVKYWDPTTGILIGVLAVSERIYAIAYSQDITEADRWLAIAVGGVGKPNEIELENMTNPKIPALLQELDMRDNQIPRSVAFSYNDHYLAAGTQEGHVTLWKLNADWKTNKTKYQYLVDGGVGGKENPVTQVSFTNSGVPSDDSTVLQALSSDQYTWWINLSGNRNATVSSDPKGSYTAAAMAPSSNYYAVYDIQSSDEAVIAVYKFNISRPGDSGELDDRIKPGSMGVGDSAPVQYLAFLDDTTLLSASSKKLTKWVNLPIFGLWDTAGATFQIAPVGMVLSQNQKFIALGLANGTVQMYMTKDLEKRNLLE